MIWRSFLFFLLLLSLGSEIALYRIWKEGIFDHWLNHDLIAWIQKKYILSHIKDLGASLPFKIEYFNINGSWKEFLNGHVRDLELRLRKNNWHAYLSGPVQVSQALQGHQLWLTYNSKVILETILKPILEPIRPSQDFKTLLIDLNLKVRVSKNFKHFYEAELAATTHGFALPQEGIQFKDGIALKGDWKLDQPISIDLHIPSFAWMDPKHPQHALNLQKVKFQGPLTSLVARAEGGEFLWDDSYLDLGIKDYSLHMASLLKPKASSQVLITLEKVKQKLPIVSLVSRFQMPLSQTSELEVEWQTLPLLIKDLVHSLSGMSWMGWHKQVEITQGTLTTRGHAHLDLGTHSLKNYEGIFELKNATARWDKIGLAGKGISLQLPFSSAKETLNGELLAKDLHYKHFPGTLEKTHFEIKLNPHSTELNIAQNIPLTLRGIPIHFGSLKGEFGPDDFELTTHADLADMPLSQFLRGFCMEPHKPFPATVKVFLPKIEISKGRVEPTVNAEVELFEGRMKISDVGFYDLNTEVPEFDFNLDLDGIRLDLLGDWLNFGKMEGFLTGFSHDTVLQSWYPTHFEAKTEIIPTHPRSQIIFSADAMKNVVRLFAGEDLNALPSWAKWLAFGLPSRLLGGYNVEYAGISVYSADGSILVRTLDPPQVFRREKRHFVLYGPRFKMPLKSLRYPLVVDATAMANFVRRLMTQLTEIAQQNLKKKKGSLLHDNIQSAQIKDTPPVETVCLPPDPL